MQTHYFSIFHFSILDSNTFYAAVYAHKSYHDARLTIDGPNLQNVTLDLGDSCIHDDGCV